MRCSLRLDCIRAEQGWVWQIFHRTSGPNQSIAGTFSAPSAVTPEEVYRSFETSGAQNSVEQLRAFGIWACNSILPLRIKADLEKAEGGDILFMVPQEWADVPFELLHISKGFLGDIYQMGTILRLKTEMEIIAATSSAFRIAILADPGGNLASAYTEGIELRDLAKRMQKEVRLLASPDTQKITRSLQESSVAHFAGHSSSTGDRHSSGWCIGGEKLFDLSDMEGLGRSVSVPWLIFSNSCNAGSCNTGSDLSGIAGAFMKAGVRQVIGPVRRVDDAQALEFAKTFYQYLFKGLNPAESLLAVRQELTERRIQASYLYRLYGDPLFTVPAGDTKGASAAVAHDRKGPFQIPKIVWVLCAAAVALIAAIMWWVGGTVEYIPPR